MHLRLTCAVLAVASMVLVCTAESHFFTTKEKMTYRQAQDYCQQVKYGHLTVITDESMQLEVTREMKRNKFKRVWIGLDRLHIDSDERNAEGGWQWKYGGSRKSFRKGGNSLVGEEFWGPLEPNNFRNHSERCVEMRDLPKNTDLSNWNDRPCWHLNNVICMQNLA